MGTITAQILIGTGHPYHGGIIPTHVLWLSENSRPAWRCHPFEYHAHPEEHWEDRQCVWIPTTENMLEDGLLLATLFWSTMRYDVLNGLGNGHGPGNVADEGHQLHPEVNLVNLANQAFGATPWRRRAELTTEIAQAELNALRHLVMGISGRAKAVVTVLGESTVQAQLPALGNYAMQFEVCLSAQNPPDENVGEAV